MDLAISTHWNAFRHGSGSGLLDEILAAGFKSVELGYDTRLHLIDGIRQYVKDGRIRVKSLHNFCPLPSNAHVAHPEIYELACLDRNLRLCAVEATARTIETAADLGASTVIAHAGNVAMRRGTHKLIKLAQKGHTETARYQRIKMKLLLRRDKAAAPYLAALTESLNALLPLLEQTGISLALENLPSWEAVPTEAELETLLKQINSPYIGYWHDFGHAVIRDNLGFISHIHWLRHLQPWMKGMHLHDVAFPAADHLMPPHGNAAFEQFREFITAAPALVLEPAPNTPLSAIIHARDFFNNILQH